MCSHSVTALYVCTYMFYASRWHLWSRYFTVNASKYTDRECAIFYIISANISLFKAINSQRCVKLL